MRFIGYDVVLPPSQLPVTPEEYIDHARLNGLTVQKQPALIDRKLKAATQRAESFCRRSLITQTVKAAFVADTSGCQCSCLCGHDSGMMVLPRGKVQTIDTVTDGNGDVLPATGYTLEGNILSLGQPLQTLGCSVVYVSGYGDDGTAVPDQILEGILEYATVLYENRAGEREAKWAADAGKSLPSGIRDLWRPYQIELHR